jgi:hypothetical protein
MSPAAFEDEPDSLLFGESSPTPPESFIGVDDWPPDASETLCRRNVYTTFRQYHNQHLSGQTFDLQKDNTKF